MSTFSAKPAEVQHEWFVIDATDKVLGRVASEVALRLRGKHKAIYTPHVDTGDFIVIINASKLKVTGTKNLDKRSEEHTSELQSRLHLVCRLLLEKKKKKCQNELRETYTHILPVPTYLLSHSTISYTLIFHHVFISSIHIDHYH